VRGGERGDAPPSIHISGYDTETRIKLLPNALNLSVKTILLMNNKERENTWIMRNKIGLKLISNALVLASNPRSLSGLTCRPSLSLFFKFCNS